MRRFKLKLYERNNVWLCHYCLDSNYVFNIEDIIVGTGRTKEEAYKSWKRMMKESKAIGREESNAGCWLLALACISGFVSVVLFLMAHAK